MNDMVSVDVLIAVKSALNFAIILVFTKLDSNTAPEPFPPIKVIFGFLL